MILREYQYSAVKEVESTFNSSNRAMLQLPTGAGKTVVFCEIAKRYFLSEVKKVLILVHRKELLEQASNSLGERCFKIKSGVKVIPKDFDYYVGMVESTHNRMERLPEFGLVIIDEAHIGNFNKLLFFKQDVKILGVSATPTSSNYTPLSDLYKSLIQPISIKDLINQKYLVDCTTWVFKEDVVAQESQNWSLKKFDFDEKQMGDFYSKKEMVQTTVDKYWQLCAGKKTIIFNASIQHNEEVFSALKHEGLNNVYSVHSEMLKSERDEQIQLFKNDPHGIMCNVGILTTGFDEPEIQCVILNRKTKSLTLYLQMIGRGARVFPGKEYFALVDIGGTSLDLGHYSKYRDWEYYFGKSMKKSKEGEAPLKVCPRCAEEIHISRPICPCCGFEFPKKETIKRKSNEMILLESETNFRYDFDKILAIGKSRGWKEYAYYFNLITHLENYQKTNPEEITDEILKELAKPFIEKWLIFRNKNTPAQLSYHTGKFFSEAIASVKNK